MLGQTSYCSRSSFWPLNKVRDTLELFQCSIEIVDIGLMMLFVVKLEQFTAKNRLQCGVVVFELWQGNLSQRFSGSGELSKNLSTYSG